MDILNQELQNQEPPEEVIWYLNRWKEVPSKNKKKNEKTILEPKCILKDIKSNYKPYTILEQVGALEKVDEIKNYIKKQCTKEFVNTRNKFKNCKTPEQVLKRMSRTEVYKTFEQYILSESELRLNNYPRLYSDSQGKVVYYGLQRFYQEKSDIFKCVRCRKMYGVDDCGIPFVKEQCRHHPKGYIKLNGRNKYPLKHSCCGNGKNSPGCYVGTSHVIKYMEDEICPSGSRRFQYGFRTTREQINSKSHFDILALDCEMCYTNKGMELIRVTIVDYNNKKVYDKLVKPKNPILDYATYFSGITEDMLDGVETSLEDVQGDIITLISSNTILIGHSLENDLEKLKICHSKIIDTSVYYSDNWNKKPSLKNLSEFHLNRVIQNNTNGHDSAEDANASFDLAKHFVKKDILFRLKHSKLYNEKMFN